MAAPGQSYMALYSSAQVNGVRGIFRSTDAGASWVRINDDQHQYASTNAAITGDPRVFGRVYISTNGRGIIYGEPSGVSNPSFSLSPNPSSLTINRGASGTSAITITRSGGFTGGVTLSASGAPSGVTVSFNPNPVTGGSGALTMAVSSTAALGPATVTITGTGGGLARTVTISLTVTQPQTPDFSLSANPTSLTINRGASGTSAITITRAGGFTSSVAFSASGLPSGVTASFSPTSTTGTGNVLTLTASGAATLGAATVTVTGTGGSLTRTTSISLTVNDSGGGTGGVTVTPVINASGPWFNEQAIRLNNTGVITSLSITIVIQRTTGVGFSGQYNTVGGQILQSNSSAATTITYQFNLAAGQTLGPGANRLFVAQMGGAGTVHPTSGDTFTVTYTTGGVTFTQTGTF
jgi:hypothetical protein